jgi:hypothetical protein
MVVIPSVSRTDEILVALRYDIVTAGEHCGYGRNQRNCCYLCAGKNGREFKEKLMRCGEARRSDAGCSSHIR